MKRTLAIALLLSSAAALGAAAQTLPLPSAPAAPAAPAGPAKIAVIAFKVAVANTNEGQRDFADLEKKFTPREQQLKALNDEVESLTKQLQSATLPEAERASKAKTLDEKKKRLDRDAEDARNDFQQEMGEMYNGLASKVYDVMAAYVQQQGFTMVLDVSDQQSPILYASPQTDISKAVVDAYNVKSGVPAPVAGAGGAKPPAAAAPRTAPRATAPAAH